MKNCKYLLQKLLSSQTTAVCIIIAAMAIRFVGLGYVPMQGETYDEYFWTMMGASLLQEGKPSSWSYFEQYDRKFVKIDDVELPMVSPNLDHPPLFALIPGMMQTLSGAAWNTPIDIFWLRLPMVFLAGIQVWLVYLIGKRGRSVRVGIVAAAIYAFSPGIILANRLILSENLLAVCMLFFLWIAMAKPFHQRRFLLILMGSIAALTKVSGAIITLAAAIDLYKRKQKDWWYPLLGAAIGVAIWLAYAALFDFRLFMAIQTGQASRLSSMATVPMLLFSIAPLISKPYLEGWLLSGKIALAALFLKTKRDSFEDSILIYSTATLLFIFIAVSEMSAWFSGYPPGASLYGWQAYLLFPFATLALAVAIDSIVRERNKLGFVFLQLLLALQFRQLFLFLDHSGQQFSFVSKPVIFAVAATILASLIIPKKYFSYYVFLWLFAAFFVSIITILVWQPFDLLIQAAYFKAFFN